MQIADVLNSTLYNIYLYTNISVLYTCTCTCMCLYMYIIHNYMYRTDLEWLSVVKRDIESYCVYIHVHVLYMYLACNINVYIQYSSRGT